MTELHSSLRGPRPDNSGQRSPATDRNRTRPSDLVPAQRQRKGAKFERHFEALAMKTSRLIGSSWSFGVAVLVIVIWAVTGPIFHYSDTWQLIINTGTTVITFLMVFILQHTQNKDGMAIQLKLDEIIAAIEGASNHMIDIEDLSEDDLIELKGRYQELAERVTRVHHQRIATGRSHPNRHGGQSTPPQQ